MTSIFPPVLESRHESIWYRPTGDMTQEFLVIQFLMPTLNTVASDLRHLQLSLRYKNNNRCAIQSSKTPDHATLYCGIKEQTEVWHVDESTKVCTLKVPYNLFDGGRPKQGCEYMLQIRFGDNTLWQDANGWLTENFTGFTTWHKNSVQNVPSSFGEWSNLQYVFCITEAMTELKVECDTDFVPTVTWKYAPKSSNGMSYNDPIEQVVLQYDWDAQDGFGGIERQFRTLTFSGQYNQGDEFVLSQLIPVAPLTNIHVSIDAITSHNSHYVDNVILPSNERTPFPSSLGGTITDAKLEAEETQDGVIAKTFTLGKNIALGGECFYSIYRYNINTYDCVKLFDKLPLTGSESYTFKDYSVEMGEEYQYAIMVSDETKILGLIRPLHEYGDGTQGYGRLMNMEVSFLDDKYHQLRLHGGVKISSFKRNTSDQFQTTIGSKFPFYIRNGAQNYRTASVSAVISINFDPTFTFLKLHDGIGLVWKNSDYNGIVIPEKDLMQEEEFSHSRWRIGYPMGSEDEQPQIAQLGLDAGITVYQTKPIPGTLQEKYHLLLTQYMDVLETVDTEKYQKDIAYQEHIKQGLNKIIEQLAHMNDQMTDWKAQQYAVMLNTKSIYHERLQKNRTNFIGTEQNNQTIFMERKFRDMVMSWLSDGKPKLYRSETEGNMIVMITGANFTPLDRTQRMVYQVSFTMTEIAEYNLQNLIEYNLIPMEIESTYNPIGEWDFNTGNPDPWVNSTLAFAYYPKFDIPSTRVGSTITSIDISEGIITSLDKSTLRYKADNLPDGIKINEKTGTIYGTPTTPNEPTKAVVTVYSINDKSISDSIIINVGRIYATIRITPEAYQIPQTVVGNPIAERNFTLVAQEEGSPPYTWWLAGEPEGIVVSMSGVNNQICTLRGAFRQPYTSGSFKLFVRDAFNQVAEATINIGTTTLPLEYGMKDEWKSLGEYEEGVEIEPVDFSVTVSGGTPGYTFSAKGIPAGLKFDSKTGIMSGTPLKSFDYPIEACAATITVTDAKKDSRSIVVFFQEILEEFLFRKPANIDFGKSTEAVNIDTDWTDYYIMLEKMADERPPVIGGKARTKEPIPYIFTATSPFAGILDNFSVSSEGRLSGHPIQTCQGGYITVRATDARNHYREIQVFTPKIIGGLEIIPNDRFAIPSMQVGEIRPQPYFRIYMSDFKNAQGSWSKWFVSDENLPEGISIVKSTDGGQACFECVGIPTTPHPGGKITVQITDGANHQAAMEVNVGQIFDEMHWGGDIEIPAMNVNSGSQVYVELPQIYGGTPPFKISGEVSPYSFNFSKTNFSQRTGLAIKGAPGAVATPQRVVELTLTDKANNSATIYVTIGEIRGPFLLTTNPKTIPDTLMIKGKTSIPKDKEFVGTVSGGSGQFIWSVVGSTTNTLPNGLIIDKDNGSIYGTPTAEYTTIDLSKYVKVTDAISGMEAMLGSYIVPQCVSAPTRNPSVFKNGATTLTIPAKNLNDSPGVNDPLFLPRMAGAKLDPVTLPTGIYLNDDYRLVGNFSLPFSTPITSTIKLVLAAQTYTPEVNITGTVIFTAVSGNFKFEISDSAQTIPVLEVGKAMTAFNVGQYRSGGIGPYTWSVTGLPTGVTLKTSGTNNEKAEISGTPTTEQSSAKTLTIYCTDSTGKNCRLRLLSAELLKLSRFLRLPQFQIKKVEKQLRYLLQEKLLGFW